MSLPQFKATITHGGVSTDYIDERFTVLNVKRRENNYDTATLTLNNYASVMYNSLVDNLDELKIYFKDASEAAWTQVFGGYVREDNPSLGSTGLFLGVNCKGYGSALESTNVNRDYGVESSNPTIDNAQEIWNDQVDNMINKSLGSANATGYTIGKTKVAAIQPATVIKYLNNPYKSNLDVLNATLQLLSATAAGSAGPHWIVDNNQDLIVNTIGAHEANANGWPTWWNTDQAGSTLVEGIDFTGFDVIDKSDDFANNVTLVTDFRRPAYDAWHASLWGNEALTSITDHGGTPGTDYVVGSNSVLFTPNGGVTGYGYYPAAANAGWDVTKWGSSRTVPRLNFYARKHAVTAATTYVRLNTVRKTDYFDRTFTDWSSEADDTWYSKSIPIGPFWASIADSTPYRWTPIGSPSWTNINSVEFVIAAAGAGGALYVDDVCFTGQIARSATNSWSISGHTAPPYDVTAKNEFQKILISRESMDDSCSAADDTGYAARICYAELLRRQKLPRTITFTVKLKPSMMPGQLAHIHACKKVDGTYAFDSDVRIPELTHTVVANQGGVTKVTATDDLTNSFPISMPDQYQLIMENLFLNSGQAKNMRAGSTVDLLIPIILKDYPS